jgi:hypothetical protein
VTAIPTLSRAEVRAIRILRQGFAIPPKTKPADLVTHTGFVRTLGGVDAYLALRARLPSLQRAIVDAAVATGELLVSPAVRGCMYLLPRSDAPMCLRFASALTQSRDQRDRERAGIEEGEIETLGKLVLKTLIAQGPLTTDALRRLLPAGSVRSLGARGKKVGVSSPLPGALRVLEFEGKIQRTPEGARLDTNTYLWRATPETNHASAKLPVDPARLHALLLDRYLAHAGIATLADFCAWSGLTKRDAKLAQPHSTAVDVSIANMGTALATPDALTSVRNLDAATEAVALLPFEDNLLHLSFGPALLVDEALHDLEVPVWGGGEATRLGDAAHMAFRCVLADGCVSAFWEYDPDARTVVVHWLRNASNHAQQRVAELAESTSAFLHNEIGHGHSFSLDTDDELRRRIALLRSVTNGLGHAKAKRRATKPTAHRK